MAEFTERRKEYRLPFSEKVIVTNGVVSITTHAANISRGGVFVKTLEPFPIDTQVFLIFTLPRQTMSLVMRSKVAHIVFDKQRCEVECGMGFSFLEPTQVQKSILNLHMLNEQATYLELRDLLKVDRPDSLAVSKCLKRMPSLLETDLLGLRYRVNRICTLFDSALGRDLKKPEAKSA